MHTILFNKRYDGTDPHTKTETQVQTAEAVPHCPADGAAMDNTPTLQWTVRAAAPLAAEGTEDKGRVK